MDLEKSNIPNNSRKKELLNKVPQQLQQTNEKYKHKIEVYLKQTLDEEIKIWLITYTKKWNLAKKCNSIKLFKTTLENQSLTNIKSKLIEASNRHTNVTKEKLKTSEKTREAA